MSEFKNMYFKVCTTPWVIARGKEWAKPAVVQKYRQKRLTARYKHRLFLPALLPQLTANRQLKHKKVSKEGTSAAITCVLSCAKSFTIITAKKINV